MEHTEKTKKKLQKAMLRVVKTPKFRKQVYWMRSRIKHGEFRRKK